MNALSRALVVTTSPGAHAREPFAGARHASPVSARLATRLPSRFGAAPRVSPRVLVITGGVLLVGVAFSVLLTTTGDGGVPGHSVSGESVQTSTAPVADPTGAAVIPGMSASPDPSGSASSGAGSLGASAASTAAAAAGQGHVGPEPGHGSPSGPGSGPGRHRAGGRNSSS